MSRRPALAIAVALALTGVVAGCGATTRTVSVTSTVTAPTTATTSSSSAAANASSPSDEVLAVPSVGRFLGRCPPGQRVWTLRFSVPVQGATETVSFTVGTGPRRRRTVQPGGSVVFRLAAGAARTRQPADGGSGHRATAVASTAALDVHIAQRTEPQTLRVDVHLALAALGGDTAQCGLVGSRVEARTYSNGVG